MFENDVWVRCLNLVFEEKEKRKRTRWTRNTREKKTEKNADDVQLMSGRCMYISINTTTQRYGGTIARCMYHTPGKGVELPVRQTGCFSL